MPPIIQTSFNWTALEQVGIAGVALGAIYFGYKIVSLFIEQWRVSTEAINRNTESFEKLTEIVDRASKREQDFQKEASGLLYEILDISRDTGRTTRKIYDKFLYYFNEEDKEAKKNEQHSSIS